jgi:hypothetical protein
MGVSTGHGAAASLLAATPCRLWSDAAGRSRAVVGGAGGRLATGFPRCVCYSPGLRLWCTRAAVYAVCQPPEDAAPRAPHAHVHSHRPAPSQWTWGWWLSR